jgi:signal transduction histidine kinase/ligand-binding sensor domain-containing protein
MRDGAPADVGTIAQTADGFLWLGTPTGLFRFDGARFERFEPLAGQTMPSTNVSALLVLPGDSLWIGYRFGGASVLANGRIVHYGAAEGMPPTSVRQFARDSSGTVWAMAQTALLERVGDRWRAIGRERGLVAGQFNAIFIDRRGTLWLSAKQEGIYVLPRGKSQFVKWAPALGDVNAPAFQEAADGTVWGASVLAGLVELCDSIGRPLPRIRPVTGDSSLALLVDHDGNAWLPGRRGLTWIPLAERPDHVGKTQTRQMLTNGEGLSGQTAWTVFRDREGSVWVGTTGGLDRFRTTKLNPVSLPQPAVYPAIAQGPGGAIWVGNSNYGLMSIGHEFLFQPGGPSGVTTAYSDRDGTLWLGGMSAKVWEKRGATFTAVQMPAGLGERAIQAIARDRDDVLWISIQQFGVFRRRRGAWDRFTSKAATGPAITIIADSLGGTWLGYPNNRLVRVRRDSVRVFGSEQGLRVGNVSGLYVRGSRVWVSGELGIQHLDDTVGEPRFRALTTADGPIRSVSGIVETTDGELWVNGSEGVTRVPSPELQRALRDSTYVVKAERFDFRDGVNGSPSQIRALPTAIRGTDGRLWFSTTTGLTWIDPKQIQRNPLPPPVQIRALVAGGRTYTATDRIALPARTTSLQIEYTALSLAVPDRLRFRYQLVGNDTGWQDAGNQRRAFYTNVGPGAYTFRVIAANDDGVWNETGASLEVTIAPTFTQTTAFVVLCAGSALGAILLIGMWRQRRTSAVIRAHFETKLAERTRIAQELHDTLLQDLSGVTLQLQAARRALDTRPHDAERILSNASSAAYATMRVARHIVWEMRAPELDECDLPDALAAVARDAIGPRPIHFALTVRGERRRLVHSLELAALRIGREAVLNAVQHANPTAVDVIVDFEPHTLRMHIRDDGRGVARRDLDDAPSGGHWGFLGMQERAGRAGGTIDVASQVGGGTSISVMLPLIHLH